MRGAMYDPPLPTYIARIDTLSCVVLSKVSMIPPPRPDLCEANWMCMTDLEIVVDGFVDFLERSAGRDKSQAEELLNPMLR